MATAAFASIATSKAWTWELRTTAEIESTVISAGPVTAFGITAEARGPRSGHDGGEIDVAIEIAGNEGAAITLTLISEADPTQRDEQHVVIATGAPTTVGFFLPAWQTCEVGPCFDDFRLEIATTTSVTLTGSVQAILHGNDDSPEPDSEVLVEVTPLGTP